MGRSLNIRILSGSYAIARLNPKAECPELINGFGFSAVIRANDELTLVCRDDQIPVSLEAERGWSCMRTIGPFPFEAAGILHSLVTPLSTNGIGVFVVCTFDGEHLLLKTHDLEKARNHLLAAGHKLQNS